MSVRGRWWLLALMLLVGAVACVDEKVIWRDPFWYAELPPGAEGFLGYSEEDSDQTVCGNCHVGQAGEWQETAHAGAWESLEASGHSSAACEGCHTVGPLGNATTAAGGWSGTGDSRYYDVQCESCHGPGLDHVSNPDATQPLASIVVGVGLESGCGECHQGTHTPYVEEWTESRHGTMNPYPQGRAECGECHEARGIFKAWGVKAEYLEKNDSGALPITCAVCHDPHDGTNPGQLRFSIEDRTESGNLCMRCHHKRGVPDAIASRGPHSPQGPLLLGEAGWRPPNFEYEPGTIVATHGTEANPRLCATCHVNRHEVTNPETGALVFQSTGHHFAAAPCLDETGTPGPGGDCLPAERSYAACTNGCHGSEEGARSLFLIVRDRLDVLVADLEGLLDQVPSTEFDMNDGRYSTAEGARFNSELGALRGSTVHNPFLVEALLTASIRQVQTDYGVTSASPVVLDNILPGVK